MTEKENKEKSSDSSKVQLKTCGIVMPISSIDGCPEKHWVDVKGIITDASKAAGFEANLVSDADDVGIIQQRIIQNLYDNEIVVCDVSCKNPNVMFELGIRLAFDKPTIIIKDDITSYSFDTSLIEHLQYPRDLRYHTIIEFKRLLAEKITATYEKSKKKDHKTFLKHFGKFTVAKIDEKEVSGQEFILEEIKQLGNKIDQQISTRRAENINGGYVISSLDSAFDFLTGADLVADEKDLDFKEVMKDIQNKYKVKNIDASSAAGVVTFSVMFPRYISYESLFKFTETLKRIHGKEFKIHPHK